MRCLIDHLRGNTARWLGFLVSAVALVVFLDVAVESISIHADWNLLWCYWPVLMGGLLFYFVAYIPMISAWTHLARACGTKMIVRSDLTYIFLVSQIAKYLPGNVGHFLGRAWMGQRRGIPMIVLGKAMALEVGGILSACFILANAALFIGLVQSETEQGSYNLEFAVGGAAVVSLLGVVLAFRRWGEWALILRPFIYATFCYLVVIVLMAAINVLILSVISERWSIALSGEVAGAFVVSWLVGFVTPGSPAGLGMREITFFSVLAGTYPNTTLVLTAAAFRLVTVAGDLLVWLAALVYGSAGVGRYQTV